MGRGRPAEVFGVKEKDRAFVDAMCTKPHPHRRPAAYQRTRARAEEDLCAGHGLGQPGLPVFAETVKGDPDRVCHEVACGHDVMLDEPGRLAQILQDAAS